MGRHIVYDTNTRNTIVFLDGTISRPAAQQLRPLRQTQVDENLTYWKMGARCQENLDRHAAPFTSAGLRK